MKAVSACYDWTAKSYFSGFGETYVSQNATAFMNLKRKPVDLEFVPSFPKVSWIIHPFEIDCRQFRGAQ